MSRVCRCSGGVIGTCSPRASARRKARQKSPFTYHLTHLMSGAASNVPHDRVLLRRRSGGRGGMLVVYAPVSSSSPFIHLMDAAGLLPMAVQVSSVSLPSLTTSSRLSMIGLPGGTDPQRRHHHFTSTFLYWSTNH